MDIDTEIYGLKRIAEELVAGPEKKNYIYDPEHKKHPHGGNWKKTEKGWSLPSESGKKEEQKQPIQPKPQAQPQTPSAPAEEKLDPSKAMDELVKSKTPQVDSVLKKFSVLHPEGQFFAADLLEDIKNQKVKLSEEEGQALKNYAGKAFDYWRAESEVSDAGMEHKTNAQQRAEEFNKILQAIDASLVSFWSASTEPEDTPEFKSARAKVLKALGTYSIANLLKALNEDKVKFTPEEAKIMKAVADAKRERYIGYLNGGKHKDIEDFMNEVINNSWSASKLLDAKYGLGPKAPPAPAPESPKAPATQPESPPSTFKELESAFTESAKAPEIGNVRERLGLNGHFFVNELANKIKENGKILTPKEIQVWKKHADLVQKYLKALLASSDPKEQTYIQALKDTTKQWESLAKALEVAENPPASAAEQAVKDIQKKPDVASALDKIGTGNIEKIFSAIHTRSDFTPEELKGLKDYLNTIIPYYEEHINNSSDESVKNHYKGLINAYQSAVAAIDKKIPAEPPKAVTPKKPKITPNDVVGKLHSQPDLIPPADKAKLASRYQAWIAKNRDNQDPDIKAKVDQARLAVKMLTPAKFKKIKPKLTGNTDIILRDNGLENDEVQELAGFKDMIKHHPQMSTKEYKDRIENDMRLPRNQAQLKAAFIMHMNPMNYDSVQAFQAAKARIQKMTVQDFGKLLASLNTDDEEGV